MFLATMELQTERPKSPAATHMLWFFLIPAFLFLGWATYTLVSGVESKKAPPTLVEKARAIAQGRSDGDRWKAAYSFAEELLKKSKDNSYAQLPKSERQEIVGALADLMQKFKEDTRLKKYLVLTLGRLNDVESLPLIKMGLNNEDEDLRFYSAWGYLETLSANPKAITDADLKVIRSWLSSSDTAFKKIATTFLVQHDDQGVRDVLPLLKDSSQEVRWNTGVALGSVKRKEGASTLKEIFSLDNLRVFGFRSAKDMEQLLRSAKVASLKLNDPGVIAAMNKLNNSVDLSTPEGRAIKSGLQ